MPRKPIKTIGWSRMVGSLIPPVMLAHWRKEPDLRPQVLLSSASRIWGGVLWSGLPPGIKCSFLDIHPWVFLTLWSWATELTTHTHPPLTFAVPMSKVKWRPPAHVLDPFFSWPLCPTPCSASHLTLRAPQPTPPSFVYSLLPQTVTT